MIVLSFDPGETTGYAVLDSSNGKICEIGSFLKWDEVSRLTVGMLKVDTQPRLSTQHVPIDVIVAEQFRLYPSAAKHKVWSDFPTVEVIGVIKYIAERRGVNVVMQSAADARIIHLKHTRQKRGDRHAYSALRHALLYLRRQGIDAAFRDIYAPKSGRTRSSSY